MSSKDSQKLISLAKQTRSSNSTQKEAMDRLISAGIFTKSGSYSKHYPALASFAKGK